MEDGRIVQLYWQREEQAIEETARKYQSYCMQISMNILGSQLDSEECVADTYLQAWNAIPPKRPASLSAFLGKITRNLAINRYQARHAEKRRGNEFALSLEELDACVPDAGDMQERWEEKAVSWCINGFLRTQSKDARGIFICRYFYCDSVSEIAQRFGYSESKVKSLLFRTRNKLKLYLEKEGVLL